MNVSGCVGLVPPPEVTSETVCGVSVSQMYVCLFLQEWALQRQFENPSRGNSDKLRPESHRQ